MTGDDPGQRIRIRDDGRSMLGREVDREVLLASCDFAVWLPSAKPDDLDQARYQVLEDEDGSVGGYNVSFGTGRGRWIRVTGSPMTSEQRARVAQPERPRQTEDDGQCFQAFWKEGTVLMLHSRGLTETEFDDVARMLKPVSS